MKTYSEPLIISGPAIYTDNGILEKNTLVVEQGIIQKIVADKSIGHAQAITFPTSYHLVPGFIDLHTHGANGYDVMDATPQALLNISKTLAKEGTTSFLATTMTADTADIEKALINVNEFMQSVDARQGAAILGVHLEGPFIAPAKMGAQRGDKIIAPNVELMQHWQATANQVIKLVTLAPEQPGSLELIHYLKTQNIIASIGHTNASYAEAVAAIAQGCKHITHLFNAMRSIHHREPAAVTAALLSPEVMVELILDGQHLHPAIVELVFKLKGKENIVLVTDAMRAKCLQAGCYDLGGQDVHVREGVAQLADGTLAGSVLLMCSAIKNMMKYSGCDLSDAVKMAAENPAKALGIFDRKGSITVNKDADFVVLNEDLKVVMTVCAGHIVYQA
jgi:N-acetylglucosamine-6-phosphate deacetylase